MDMSSLMEVEDFVPDFNEEEILGGSDVEDVELVPLDPKEVDDLLGPGSGTEATGSSSHKKDSCSPSPPVRAG
jgi:hypothetical protein